LRPDIAAQLAYGGDPNTVLSAEQKAWLAQRQWDQEQEERRRAPVWTVGDLKATLEDLPDDMEVQLDLDVEEGLAAWLRAVYTSDIMADIRQPPGPANRQTLLVLSWEPPEPAPTDAEEPA
jgi:hypothetical protein